MNFTYKPYRDACYERACRYRAVARYLAALAAVAMWARYLAPGARTPNAFVEACCVSLIYVLLQVDSLAARREHRISEEDPDLQQRGRRRAPRGGQGAG